MPPTVTPSLHSPALPRRKGEITAKRVLDAAENLFAARGFSGTTLRDVASAAGLRTPSLYNHFDSKDALYEAVLKRGIGPLLATLAEAVAENQRDPDRAPSWLAERLMVQLAERPKLPQLIAHEVLTGGDRLNPLLRQWINPAFASADRMIATGPAMSRWKPEQLPLLVIAMYNIMLGYFTFAPLYKELNGVDLLEPEALTAQTRLFGDIVKALFLPTGKSGSD